MKRRVLVAQALVHRPAVIGLDEPTAGVDIQLRESLWRFVKSLNEEGHTIILTTHYLEEAESLCRHIGFLKRGELVTVSDTQSLLSGAYALEGRSRLEQVFRRIFETEDTALK
jgi:ABC-2 type transport system ATP-binding protein